MVATVVVNVDVVDVFSVNVNVGDVVDDDDDDDVDDE